MSMRKLLILMMMSLLSLSAMARDVIFDASVDKGNYDNNDTPYYESITKDGVTISSSNGLWNLTEDYYLVCKQTGNYSSGLSVTCNQLITKIVINCTASGTSQYGPGNLSNTSYTYDGNIGICTGENLSVNFNAIDDVQINSIIVTVDESILYGDVNGDGNVDPDDYNALLRFFLYDEIDDIVQGDLDGDGCITAGDLNVLYDLILNHYPFEVYQYINHGDVNGDGKIDNKDTKVIYDLIIYSNSEYNENADINKDNVVDAWDYFIVLLLIKNHNPYANSFSLDNISYQINDNQTSVTVIGCYSNLRGAVEIPSTVHYNNKDYVVTVIGDNAFEKSLIASISIPNTVTWIGNKAFSNSSDLTSVTIGNSVTHIGNSAFSGCSGLTSVTIPNSVTSIGSQAFSGCSGLTSVTIPNSVTSIGYNAFSNCRGLTSVTLNSNAIVSSSYSSSSTIGSIFGSQVEEYIIGDNVTSIGSNAFRNCTSLTSVTIGNSVTEIGGSAFSFCTRLTSIVVNSGNTKYDSRNNCNAIIETATNSLIIGCKSTIIPNSVTSIGEYAFSDCSDLTSVTIPNSVTTIGNSAFYHCNGLMSVTIGNSVTSIGSYAFSGCSGLTELFCYNVSPPSLGTSCFTGINSDIPVYVPMPNMYEENSSWSKYFSIFLPLGNNKKLTVNLPSVAFGGKYKDMYIEARNTKTEVYFRCLVTDKMSYNFSVPGNSTYDIVLENSIGVKFGEIKNVEVKDADKEVSFSTLLTPQTVALAVTLPNGEDVTDKVSVTWTDSEDNFLAQGSSISGMAAGISLKYEVKLPQDLAMEYEQPANTEYTVKDSNNGFVVKLQPFGKSTISGKVCDKATGAPLNRATATISQVLNGKHSVSSTATTDNDGNFSAEVYKAPSKVTVAAKDYVSLTTDISITDDVSLGTMQLEKIDGAVINIGFTYQASVKQGETVTVQNFFEDYNNVSYSIYNKTQKKNITQFSAQYPEIVLLEDVNESDELLVTVHSIKGEFNDVQASCFVNNNAASITLPIVEYGAIEAIYSDSQTDNVVGMLFNSDGEQVTRDAYYNKSLSLSNINDGEYTLVTMQANDYMNSVLTLSSLASMGMKSGDDYISSKVTVNSGTISDVQVAAVPAIDTSELLYTSSNTYFTANKPSVTVGNYVTLSANIDFKKAYQGQVQDLNIIFDLPQGCEFVDNSVMMGNSVHSYSVNDNKIIISDPVCGENIKFCVIPTLIGNMQPSAILQFTINGKQVTQPIGSALVEAKGLDINVPATTNSSEIAISGFAPYNSSVEVFDGDKLIGTTKSGLSGNWNLTASLTDTFNVSVHEIQAHATTPQGKELMSESVDCLYDNSYIVPQTITLIYRNYTSVFYPMEKRTVGTYYSYVSSSPEFTLIAQFNTDSPDKLANVMFNVLTSDNKIKAFPAVYDEATCKWVASAEFPSFYSLPVNVNVSYDVIKDTPDDLSPNLLSDIENADHLISEVMDVIQEKFTAENCTYDDENIYYELVSDELGQNWPCNIQLLNYDEVAAQMIGDDDFIEVENEGKHIWVKIWDDDNAVHSIFVNKEEKIAISYDISLTGNRSITCGKGKLKGVAVIAFFLPLAKDFILGKAILRQTKKVMDRYISSAQKALDNVEALKNLTCPNGTFLFDESVRSEIDKHLSSGNKELDSMKKGKDFVIEVFNALISRTIITGVVVNVAMMGLPMGEAGMGAITSPVGKTFTQFALGEALGESINALFSESYNGLASDRLSWFSNKYANIINSNSQFIMSLRNKKRNCEKEEVPTNTEFPAQPVTAHIDPSGFVYEAVPSNRLQGVTATIYYKETVEDMYGEPVEQEVMWDAEEYAQKNPLFTDENGMYQWDVPQGMWQVRFNKNGYEPTRSEWLPVPPPQLDVNIGMTQLRQPEVAMVHAYKDGVVLTFDKYMRPETLTTDNISVTQNGENVTGTIELMNEEQGDNEKFASKLRFVPLSEFTAKTVTLNVKNDVESYAGIRMNSDFTQTFDIEKQIYVIGIDTLINVGYGESREVLVEALPVDVAKGKTLNVRSVQPLIAEVDNENYTLDKHGRATITVSGNLPGATSIILNVEGFDLKKNATVQVVDQSSLVTEKPIASVANGLVFDEGFTVELTCSTPGAVIYYTTNGACPCDEEERILYNGPITINTNTTLKAIAIAPGYYESDIATYYYFQSSAIDEISYDAPFKVSPTMVRDGFVVKGNFYECDVMLYSLNGSMVLHNEHVGSGEFVSLGSLNSGVYVAVVTINGRPYPVKIVKM